MDDELELPKGSLLKQLNNEDIAVHSIEVLLMRITVLEAEIARTQAEIGNKKSAHSDADSIFK
ncbi:MAG: DUF1192 family protein [Emcibacteraceae bacterium]|nr:DUF1192 family protein [Emcibacteraceae bacterium]MDG1996893.1 DUF1192 family protein [Emcibacteraceae bacterium]